MAFVNHLALVAAVSLLVWLAWTGIYRLFLHPLAKVPGPPLAALTTWYEVYYDLWLPGQYPFQIKKLHERYGPVIRPVPDEIHISDPAYLDTIYALRGRNTVPNGGILVPQAVGTTEDFHHHKLRRDALNPYFNQKYVLTMEDPMIEKRDRVIDHVEDAMKSGRPLNLSNVFFAFANDFVRNVCFGSDSGLLDDLAEASRQRRDLLKMLSGIKINRHFPFVPKILSKILGPNGVPPAVMDLLRFKARAGRDIEAVFADKSNDNKGRHSLFYELRDSPILPPEEKTVSRLQDEATLIIMAGTGSTSKSLDHGIYYLLDHPESLRKLRQELDEARRTATDGQLSLARLLSLPYLNAVMTEINRLTYGATNRMVRYAPTETLTYSATYGPQQGETYVFPPRTKMSSLSWCVHMDEDIFPDPLSFNPERFMGHGPEVTRRKRCMMSLGLGHRRCVGIHLANAGIGLMLAKLLEYDLEIYETTADDVAFKHDYQIAHPKLTSQGVQVKVKGKVGMGVG